MNEKKELTEFRLDESNDLYFKISVHGAERSPETIRLVCEIEDIAFSFKGKKTEESGVVKFTIPVLKESIKNGQLCEARVEVIVDDHYFVPVKFNAEFIEPVKVVAEAMTNNLSKKQESNIDIQAKPITKAQYQSLRDRYKLNKDKY